MESTPGFWSVSTCRLQDRFHVTSQKFQNKKKSDLPRSLKKIDNLNITIGKRTVFLIFSRVAPTTILNWKKAMKFYPLAHIFYISCPSLIPGAYCFRRGPRLQNSPYFAYSRTREQSNKRSGTRLKTESERLERFARVRLLRHALAISLLILRKQPTVLQSTVDETFG